MVSNNIKLGRKIKNINQTQLVKVIGISKQTICDWEKGRSIPKNKNLIKLAKYFGITIDDLLIKTTTKKNCPNSPVKTVPQKQIINK